MTTTLRDVNTVALTLVGGSGTVIVNQLKIISTLVVVIKYALITGCDKQLSS